jgi:hypothetical protein
MNNRGKRIINNNSKTDCVITEILAPLLSLSLINTQILPMGILKNMETRLVWGCKGGGIFDTISLWMWVLLSTVGNGEHFDQLKERGIIRI